MNVSKSFFQRYRGWIIAAGIFFFGIYSVVQYNGLHSSENGIEASDRDYENALGSGYKKIESQGMASDKAFALWEKAIGKASASRYSEDGIQAAITLIKEDNSGLDMTVIEALQDAITATFNKIESIQRDKIDKVRVYEDKLDQFPTSVYAKVFGFPTIDMEKAKRVISSEEAKEAMESGKLPTPEM